MSSNEQTSREDERKKLGNQRRRSDLPQRRWRAHVKVKSRREARRYDNLIGVQSLWSGSEEALRTGRRLQLRANCNTRRWRPFISTTLVSQQNHLSIELYHLSMSILSVWKGLKVSHWYHHSVTRVSRSYLSRLERATRRSDRFLRYDVLSLRIIATGPEYHAGTRLVPPEYRHKSAWASSSFQFIVGLVHTLSSLGRVTLRVGQIQNISFFAGFLYLF